MWSWGGVEVSGVGVVWVWYCQVVGRGRKLLHANRAVAVGR